MNTGPWLALLSAASPVPAALRRLLREHGTAEAVLNLSHRALTRAGLSDELIGTVQRPDHERMARWREWLTAAPDRHLITMEDTDFPPLLGELPDAPAALWVEGDRPARLQDPQIAVVGSRNPTPSGRELARDFAACFANAGLTVTSGLASGIDAAAHTGALHGPGGTIGVLGSGLSHMFPAANRKLARDMTGNGLLVSEYPPDVAPLRHHFPQRNRIIAGLALATVVIEAGRRSGSLITARLAAEAGREVFAVPGSVHNPMARGCHALIRQGATLVEHGTDVLADLSTQLQRELAAPQKEQQHVTTVNMQPSLTGDESYVELLNFLDFSPTAITDMEGRSGLTAAELSSMLLLLEMEGYVEALPGGRYVRTAKRCR